MNRQLKRTPLEKDNANFKPRQVRNGVLAKAIGLALIASSTIPSIVFATTLEGYKFNDLNNNKVMDVNEPILANETISIRTSTGSRVDTSTDESGFFKIEINDGPISFTVWSRIASGWVQTTPVEGTGMRPYTTEIYTQEQSARIDIGIRDIDVQVEEPPPNTTPQQVNITPSIINIQEGSEISFKGSFVDPDLDDVHTIEWQFGDGDIANGIETSHIYSTPGNYTATLTVTDKKGAVGTSNVDILVIPKPNTIPISNAGEDITTHVDEQVQFNGNVVDPDLNDTHTFEWDFGDGSDTSTLQNTSHTYLKAGTFTTSLTVKDNHGGVSVNEVKIQILPSEGWIAFDADNPILEETPPTLNVPETDSQELIVEFNIPGTNSSELTEEDTIYHQLNLLQESSISEVGKPELPMLSRLIAIPKNAITNVQIISFDVQEIEGYNIYPAQKLLTDEDLVNAPLPVFTKDDKVYGRDEFYPANIAKLDDSAIIRGTSVAALRVFPVQFNPVTQKLKIYSNIRVKVSFEGGVDNFTDDKVLTPSHEQLFEPLLLNGSNALSVGDADSAYEADNSLLIITHPNFLAAANTLAVWKIKRGIHTIVKTTAEIGSTASSIQKYIKDAYKSATASKPPPSYVLFIGDAEFIPTHYKTIHPDHGFLTGTDLYYATVDGPDYLPDIYLGRLSIDTLAQANKRVNDIVDYEKAVVVDSSFYEKATSATYFQDRDKPWRPIDGRDNRRFAMTSEDISLYLESKDYSVDRIYYTESDVTPAIWGKYFGGGPAGNAGSAVPAYLRKPGFAWDGDANDIKTAINQGRFLVTHRDHGHRTIGWGDPRYTPTDVSALTNGNKLPVIWSINCETGWFDNETDPVSAETNYDDLHFSEAWERNSNGGAVGIIAATRFSYSNHNDRLAWGLMDAIWPAFEPSTPAASPIWEMGAVLNYGKYYMFTKSLDDIYMKTEFEGFHWFGDPSMEIWTDVPQPLNIAHDASIVEGTTSIDVNVNTAGALIAVSKTNAENGEILGKSMSINGVTNISLSKPLAVGEQVSVVVTKHNYRPYEGAVTVKEDTPCSVPTVTSNGVGGWTPKAPEYGDIALILAGHTVTTDFVDTTNLCIEEGGKLLLPGGKLLYEAYDILVSDVFLNQGDISVVSGENGSCLTGTHDASRYVHATPAKNIEIYAGKFVNEGTISGGKGGDDSTWKCLNDNDPGAWSYTFIPSGRTHSSTLGTWSKQYNSLQIGYGFPSVGETAGGITIESNTFTNKGIIEGGEGGYGDSSSKPEGEDWGGGVHGTTIGGQGGFLTINVADLAGSTNTGTLKGGCGGHADIPGSGVQVIFTIHTVVS
ncbi:MAG: C25 family cysteine peptidase [Candidatus Marithrix sp.]